MDTNDSLMSPELGDFIHILLGHAATHQDSEYIAVLDAKAGELVAVTDGWASAEVAKQFAGELNDILGIVEPEATPFAFVAIRASRALDFVLDHRDRLDRLFVADTEIFTTCGVPHSVVFAVEWEYHERGGNCE